MRTRILRTPLMLLITAGAILGMLTSPGWAKDKKKEDYVQFKKEKVEGEPVPGRVLIYVMRPASAGFAIKSWFFVDDRVLGVNKGSSYFFTHVDPGKHVFWSKSENVDALELEVEAGETYYFQQHVRMSWGKARTKIEALDSQEGPKILAKCPKHSLMTETGLARGQELAARLVRAQNSLVLKQLDSARPPERHTSPGPLVSSSRRRRTGQIVYLAAIFHRRGESA